MTNNLHASLITIKGEGVLITGPSGSGKTLLALHLFRRCKQSGVEAQIIADDQVILNNEDGYLTGAAPELLRGKIEIRGLGIVTLPEPVIDQAKIDLHVSLDKAENMRRYWDGETILLNGIQVKSLSLCTKQIEAAANAILFSLKSPLWL